MGRHLNKHQKGIHRWVADNHSEARILIRISILSLGVLLLSNAVNASAAQNQVGAPIAATESEESYGATSSAIAIDNDILVPGSRDQDYTYGINLTLAGRQVANHRLSLHRPLDWINDRIGMGNLTDPGIGSSKIEYGLFGFTPEDISQSAALQDDRPYSSLIYVSSTRENYNPQREVSWQTTLTLGVLGLNIVGDIQQLMHSTYNGTEPRGWSNQISAGGEFTARYSISRQRLLRHSNSGLELKSTLQGSLGYITEASWSLGVRIGEIRTPWVSFNPELTSYAEKSNPNSQVKVSEQYAWGGISFKFRAYNAFLEGQFRDSEVTYRGGDINRGIVELWLGYTVALTSGYSFTYSIRGHTSELKHGNGNRDVVWGGVLISKTIH